MIIKVICSLVVAILGSSMNDPRGEMSIRVLKRPIWYSSKDGELQLKRIVKKDPHISQISENAGDVLKEQGPTGVDKRIFPIPLILSDNLQYLYRIYKIPAITF